MTFRRLYTADGIHDYFWKAKPVRTGGASGTDTDTGAASGSPKTN
jgi:hypothetical protein